MPMPIPMPPRAAAARAEHHAVRAELEAMEVSAEAARANRGDAALLRWNLGRCAGTPMGVGIGCLYLELSDLPNTERHRGKARCAPPPPPPCLLSAASPCGGSYC